MKKIKKDYILNNLIKQNGSLNGNKTKYLKESNEDLYLIYHDYKTVPKCVCGKDRKFISFTKGYRVSCGSHVCKNTKNTKNTEKPIKNIDKEYISSILTIKNYPNPNKTKYLKESNEDLYLIYHDYKTVPKCVCGKDRKFISFTKGYTKFCSYSCSNKSKQTSFQSKETQLLNAKKNKEKLFLQEGVYFSSQKHIKHYTDYNKKGFLKFVKNNHFYINECMSYFNIKKSIINRNKNIWGIHAPNKNNKNNNIAEDELHNIVKEFRNNKSIISPFELDIYSEKHKFAIEYNGLMWHSYGKSKYSQFNNYNNENRKKHLNKTELCEEKGIQLYHIFENEWLDPIKKQIWISMINNKMNNSNKIGARKCTIKEVPNKDSKEFLNENHMQGSVNSLINIGLYHKDILVSLMTFGKSRMSKKYEYEILRMCNKINNTVQGGFSKMLLYFEKEYNPKSLVSYANRRWSEGNVYKRNGFILNNISKPNYFYFLRKEGILWSRNKFQKHKLKKILNVFDNTLTEAVNVFNNGYRRIWDSGNLVFVKQYKKEYK